jgi:group II intron reverse transcriptase/maturase
MSGSHSDGKRDTRQPLRNQAGPHGELQGDKTVTYGNRESDSRVVPEREANKAAAKAGVAEVPEGRRLTEGNPGEQNTGRTQDRETVAHALERIREAVRREPDRKLTTLWHHVYSEATLREAYRKLNPNSSPGVDGQSWQSYGRKLEERIPELSGRLKRMGHRPQAVLRRYIPKDGGKQRPIGVPVLEDKIVERALVMVLEVIYEEQFANFSYGFRPARGPHHALDALYMGIVSRKVNWVLDADLRGYFDAIPHDWLVRMLEHRIADRRVVRYIIRCLKAGVVEDGYWREQAKGSPQGGCLSPMLANIFLHYVLDLWVKHWRKSKAKGDLIIVRYADDFVVGLQYRQEAQRFERELRERLQRYGLELNQEKSRLIEFGRFAEENRRQRGEGKPETFDFLGLTHLCGKDRHGKFKLKRKTVRGRMSRKLRAIKMELRKRHNQSVPTMGRWLRSVLTGHYQYYGVPDNYRSLATFRKAVLRLWKAGIGRQSQKGRATWKRMDRLSARWLPKARICHPYPSQRLCVP